MEKEQVFQYWHEKDKIATCMRDECCSSNSTTGNIRLSDKLIRQNQEVSGSSQDLQKTENASLDVRLGRNQRSTASFRQVRSSGIVAKLKNKWEHGHDRELESTVQQSTLSPQRDKGLHKPVRKSNSFSPPARRPLNKVMLSVSHNNDPNSVKLSLHSGTTLKSDDSGVVPSNGKVSLLLEAIEPTLPTYSSVADNVSTIAQAECQSVHSGYELAEKVTSSISKCHLDGPADVPSSCLPKVKDLLQSVEIPREMNFVVSSGASVEAVEFWNMVDMLSEKFSGLIQQQPKYLDAPVLSQQFNKCTADCLDYVLSETTDLLTVIVETSPNTSPMKFKCSQKSKVSSILDKAVNNLHVPYKIPKNYSFKVCGRDEYLQCHQCLCDYEYVQMCRKYSTEVKLILVNKLQAVDSSKKIITTSTEELSTKQGVVSQSEIDNLLKSFYTTELRFRNVITVKDVKSSGRGIFALAQSVVSCVKLLCEWLALVEPPKLTEAVYEFRRACKVATQSKVKSFSGFQLEGSQSYSNESWVSVTDHKLEISTEDIEDMTKALDVLKSAVHETVSLYCNSFYPGYQPIWLVKYTGQVNSTTVARLLKIKICALHRINDIELRKFESLQIEVSLYHGGKLISKKMYSPLAKLTKDFFYSVVWDKWINSRVPVKFLPRESRFLFVLYGVELSSAGTKQNKVVLSWTSLNIFNSQGILESRSVLLGMQLGDDIDPRVSPSSNIEDQSTALLQVSLEDHEKEIRFTTNSQDLPNSKCSVLSPNTLHTLTTLAKKDRFYCLTSDEEKLLWNTRFSCSSYLRSYPRGLPLVLLSTPYWHTDALMDIWSIIQRWPLSDATFGLELLDPQ